MKMYELALMYAQCVVAYISNKFTNSLTSPDHQHRSLIDNPIQLRKLLSDQVNQVSLSSMEV